MSAPSARSSAPTDSELVASGPTDLTTVVAVLGAAIIAIVLDFLHFSAVPALAVSIAGTAVLVFAQNRRLTAVLRRRSRRRAGGEDVL